MKNSEKEVLSSIKDFVRCLVTIVKQTVNN
jgi:hypothetical protein